MSGDKFLGVISDESAVVTGWVRPRGDFAPLARGTVLVDALPGDPAVGEGTAARVRYAGPVTDGRLTL